MIQYQQEFINSDALPIVWRIVKEQDAKIDSICSWLSEHHPVIEKLLDNEGSILIRGFKNLKTAEDFERVITTISPTLIDYVGGTSPREKIQGKIMNATNLPPNWSIPLHQEMSYTKNPPDRIAFFCVQPAISGGFSTLGDMRKITKKIDHSVMQLFKASGVQLCRFLPSIKNLNAKIGVQKPWAEVFGTEDPLKVNQIAAEKGWHIDWNNTDIRLRQEVLPATKNHPVCNAEVWFNQTHLFSPVCSIEHARRDARWEQHQKLVTAFQEYPDLLDTVLYGNGNPIDNEVALKIEKIHHASAVPIKLEKSDLLILDNTLVAHGRSPFTGQREIMVALMNVPYFRK